jgi:hypothetical protein
MHSPLEKKTEQSLSLLLSKNWAMPVHAGTQRWISDGIPISLTFTVLCIPIPQEIHTPMYTSRCASAGERKTVPQV